MSQGREVGHDAIINSPSPMAKSGPAVACEVWCAERLTGVDDLESGNHDVTAA